MIRATGDFIELRFEGGRRSGHGNAVLRTFRAGDGRNDVTQIKQQCVGEHRFRRIFITPHALRLSIGFDQRDQFSVTPGERQVIQTGLCNREEPACRTVFRCHVGNGRLIGKGQIVEAGAIEFDELSDHAFFTQHFNDGQHQISCRRAFRHGAGQLKPDHFRHQH